MLRLVQVFASLVISADMHPKGRPEWPAFLRKESTGENFFEKLKNTY